MSQNSPTLLPSRETGASPSCLSTLLQRDVDILLLDVLGIGEGGILHFFHSSFLSKTRRNPQKHSTKGND